MLKKLLLVCLTLLMFISMVTNHIVLAEKTTEKMLTDIKNQENTYLDDILTYERKGGYYTIQGEWQEEQQYKAKYTDLIAVSYGDEFVYTGLGIWHAASVLWYDSEKNLISYEQYGEWGKNLPTVHITAPIHASFVRFCSFDSLTTSVILRVSYAPKADSNKSVLSGKKIVYDGDSICYGAGYKGGYGKLIAQQVNGSYENFASGGARLVTAGENGTYHSVVDNLENLPVDGDLYCFQGGINDYWTRGTLGTYDYKNFDGPLDTTTVCGALETIFRYCLNNLVGKPICFVITHKIQKTAYKENEMGNTFKDYRDAMVGICQKYSIPYYDAFYESGLNGWNTAQNNAFLTGNSAGEPDGCHPNEQGYLRYYVPQLISLFETMMPIDVVKNPISFPDVYITNTDAIPLGDINGDTKIDAKDALILLKISVGKIHPTEEEKTAADVNKDGDINAKDALEMLKYAVGKPSVLDQIA